MHRLPTHGDMAHLYVSDLFDMPGHVARLRPEWLISLISNGHRPETPPEIDPTHHLCLAMQDIENPDREGGPRTEHIARLVAFFRAAPPSESILIHCMAGVSRSPAAALIGMVVDTPGAEHEAARVLQRTARFVDPNRLMIRLADDYLEREGRLVEARSTLRFSEGIPSLGLITLPRSVKAPV